ncbi:uncharacterized protein LOC113566346 [Drosophila persimilis]|uniref:uncharacterized protein LOC113566346 n=1 Tax=Drosophila persimilis TaxID=7234 RepID=UPI000F077B46|nr:uncharacterized protein LOC113566346 [Drosophila persimilis]
MPRYQKLINEDSTMETSTLPQQKHSKQPQVEHQLQHRHQYQQQPPNVGYHLYLYRQQLARRNVEYMRLSKAKYCITDTLLAKTVRNLKACTVDELKTVNNQIVFRHKLKHQIRRLRKLQFLGIKNANPQMESTEL